MSYHRDLTREIAALDDLVENHLKRLEVRATPEQVAILNELKQVLTLKRELLRKLVIAAKADPQQSQIVMRQYISDEIN